MVNFVGLHGFWSAPVSFNELTAILQPEKVFIPDLFSAGPLDPSHDFDVWTENFEKELESRFSSEPVVLVGYSLGGRLALHAMIKYPRRFSAALLLSTNPGQLNEEQRAARAEWVQLWKKKFLTEDWDRLQKDWNSLPIFSGSRARPRRRVPRELLAQATENWSLLNHRFGWEDLKGLEMPVQWAFGALDHKYLAVKAQLERQNVKGRFFVISGAGHRLLQDVPSAIAELL